LGLLLASGTAAWAQQYVLSTIAGLSVTGLRTRVNERSDFLITTTPPTVESNPASPREGLFPHFADGGGYTTQFILFSGTAGQSSSGTLGFFNQGGQSWTLTAY
jgi:subtilisin family serine protease